MFAFGALRRICNVVCRGKCPFAVFAEKTEVLGMIVGVADDKVKVRALEHLRQILRTAQTQRERHKRAVIQARNTKVAVQKSCGGRHVYLASGRSIESLDPKPSGTFGGSKKMRLRHCDTGLFGKKRNCVLKSSTLGQILHATELNKPRTCTCARLSSSDKRSFVV